MAALRRHRDRRRAARIELLILDEGNLLRIAVLRDDEVLGRQTLTGLPFLSLTLTVCTTRCAAARNDRLLLAAADGRLR